MEERKLLLAKKAQEILKDEKQSALRSAEADQLLKKYVNSINEKEEEYPLPPRLVEIPENLYPTPPTLEKLPKEKFSKLIQKVTSLSNEKDVAKNEKLNTFDSQVEEYYRGKESIDNHLNFLYLQQKNKKHLKKYLLNLEQRKWKIHNF